MIWGEREIHQLRKNAKPVPPTSSVPELRSENERYTRSKKVPKNGNKFEKSYLEKLRSKSGVHICFRKALELTKLTTSR